MESEQLSPPSRWHRGNFNRKRGTTTEAVSTFRSIDPTTCLVPGPAWWIMEQSTVGSCPCLACLFILITTVTMKQSSVAQADYHRYSIIDYSE